MLKLLILLFLLVAFVAYSECDHFRGGTIIWQQVTPSTDNKLRVRFSFQTIWSLALFIPGVAGAPKPAPGPLDFDITFFKAKADGSNDAKVGFTPFFFDQSNIIADTGNAFHFRNRFRAFSKSFLWEFDTPATDSQLYALEAVACCRAVESDAAENAEIKMRVLFTINKFALEKGPQLASTPPLLFDNTPWAAQTYDIPFKFDLAPGFTASISHVPICEFSQRTCSTTVVDPANCGTACRGVRGGRYPNPIQSVAVDNTATLQFTIAAVNTQKVLRVTTAGAGPATVLRFSHNQIYLDIKKGALLYSRTPIEFYAGAAIAPRGPGPNGHILTTALTTIPANPILCTAGASCPATVVQQVVTVDFNNALTSYQANDWKYYFLTPDAQKNVKMQSPNPLPRPFLHNAAPATITLSIAVNVEKAGLLGTKQNFGFLLINGRQTVGTVDVPNCNDCLSLWMKAVPLFFETKCRFQTATPTFTAPTCIGCNDGTISIQALSSNGPPYTISFLKHDANATPFVLRQTTAAAVKAINLPPKIYTFIIADVKGCEQQFKLDLLANTPGMSLSPPTLAAGTLVDATCKANGKATLTPVLNLNMVESVLWRGRFGGIDNVAVNTGKILVNAKLEFGKYQAEIHTSNGKVMRTEFVIAGPNYDKDMVVTIKNTPVTCKGKGDGSISISVTGGAPPYTVAWADDAKITSFTRSPLGAATYTATVKDSLSCSQASTIVVIESATAFTIAKGVTAAPSCDNRPDGIISVTPTGGTAPYTYLWTFPCFGITNTLECDKGFVPNQIELPCNHVGFLLPGDYKIQGKDKNGCLSNEVTDTVPKKNKLPPNCPARRKVEKLCISA